jgi:hypothetical protein
MLRTDLLLGEFETVATVYRWGGAQLLRLADSEGGSGLVFVPEDAERGRRETEMLALLKYPGVPECRRRIESDSGTTALVLHGADDAVPLALVHDLPEPTLRAGLVALLQTVGFAHSRGIVHRRIDRSQVLVDPSGRFWLLGWGDASPVSDVPPPTSVLAETAADLRDLARAFREALLRRPWPDPAGATIHERAPRVAAGQELIDAGVKVDRDFARVLSRLVAADPRDAYTGATDVLADMSAVDATAFDPWESVRPIGTRRDVARVMRLLDHTRLATSETVLHAASVDYVGPDGAGKSRMLAEIARVARSRGVIVLTADGGALGTWGGVGALARQLVQLLGRGARMCVQHESALRHLLGECDVEPRPPEPPPGVSRDPLISACIAAVTDLVRMAFRETPGLLILDDEDNLTPAARHVWRSTGEFVQSINGGGGVLRALLVSASTRTYAPEVGAQRITVELAPWRQRDVEKFLARAFPSPGGAREASSAIFALAGGRPADVVGYLRELERRGLLRREGLRWHLTAPLSTLPPLAGGAPEHVRRALESCSRDAVALVESLAVARDVRLSRSAVGDLCDVRGPRLAAAADSAVAAGLLVVDGAAWRVRTDAIAQRVRVAIPDDRRRVMHREVLNVLLEATPLPIDAVAVHARASRDPRAAEWTRAAIEAAQAEGEWGRALLHLDDAAALLGGEFAGLEAELRRADLLTSLGRVGDVIELLRPRRADEYASLDVRLRGLLLLTRAYYEARDWLTLLDLEMPDTYEAPQIVAELRFIRAAAMRHVGRAKMAEREARLAAAETAGAAPGAPAATSVTLARLEYEYQTALYAHQWPPARAALVAKLRLGRRAKDKRQMIVDLTKLGNAMRYLGGTSKLAIAVLIRAIAVSRMSPNVGGAVKSALYGCLAFLRKRPRSSRHARRLFARSSFHAVQSGAASLAEAARVRLIASRAAVGVVTFDDKVYLKGAVLGPGGMSDSTLLSVSVDLGEALLYYGFQDELERLSERLWPYVLNDMRGRMLQALIRVGRMWLDEPPSDLAIGQPNEVSPRQIVRSLARPYCRELWPYSVAYCAMRTEYLSDKWLQRFIARGGALRLTRIGGHTSWGATSLALALALWIPIEHNEAIWDELLAIVRRNNGPLPIALEWQRVLMESRQVRREGDWHRSEALRRRAIEQLDLLLSSEYGERGARAHAKWMLRVNRSLVPDLIIPPTPRLGIGIRPGADQTNSAAVVPSPTATPRSWERVLESILRTGAEASIVITTPHLRELELFNGILIERTAGSCVCWRDCDTDVTPRLDGRDELVLVAPNLWPAGRLRRAYDDLAGASAIPRRVVTLLTIPLHAFRSGGPVHRSLSERMDGRIEQLEEVCRDTARREAVFLAAMTRASATTVVGNDVIVEIVRYDWPGGLAEVERVVDAIVARCVSPVTLEVLNSTGWRLRVEARDDGLLEDERRLLHEIAACSCAGIAHLAAAIGRPRRTVLRYLNRLVEAGSVVRTGRGRATLYRARPPRRSSHGCG